MSKLEKELVQGPKYALHSLRPKDETSGETQSAREVLDLEMHRTTRHEEE